MNLPITKIPTKTLSKPSKKLTKEELLDSKMQKFIKDMIPTMYEESGIGLAAPQVALNVQLCVVGKEASPHLKKDLVLVNPTFEVLSKKKEVDTEGCLSVPGTFGKVKRFNHIHVKAWDEKGKELDFEAKNFFARVIQHEYDHLQGTLIIDKAKDMYSKDAETAEKFLKDFEKYKN